MKAAKVRLTLAAVLFGAWISWLAYLAATTTQPIILYRPQILISTLDVIGEVRGGPNGPDPEVTVRDVHWPVTDQGKVKGKKITVTNLATLTKAEGWTGPDRYILPLVRDGDNYRVAAIPPAPGIDPTRVGQPHIYRATSSALRQLEETHKSKFAPAPGRPLEGQQ